MDSAVEKEKFKLAHECKVKLIKMEMALIELGTCVEEVAAERAAIEADSKKAAEDAATERTVADAATHAERNAMAHKAAADRVASKAAAEESATLEIEELRKKVALAEFPGETAQSIGQMIIEEREVMDSAVEKEKFKLAHECKVKLIKMEMALIELGTCVEEVAAERAAIEADSKKAAEDAATERAVERTAALKIQEEATALKAKKDAMAHRAAADRVASKAAEEESVALKIEELRKKFALATKAAKSTERCHRSLGYTSEPFVELKVQQQRRVLASALEAEDFVAANDSKVMLIKLDMALEELRSQNKVGAGGKSEQAKLVGERNDAKLKESAQTNEEPELELSEEGATEKAAEEAAVAQEALIKAAEEAAALKKEDDAVQKVEILRRRIAIAEFSGESVESMELKVQQQRRILVSALEAEDFVAANNCKAMLYVMDMALEELRSESARLEFENEVWASLIEDSSILPADNSLTCTQPKQLCEQAFEASVNTPSIQERIEMIKTQIHEQREGKEHAIQIEDFKAAQCYKVSLLTLEAELHQAYGATPTTPHA